MYYTLHRKSMLSEGQSKENNHRFRFFFLIKETRFSLLRFSATVDSSFQNQVQNNRPCHFKKSVKPIKLLSQVASSNGLEEQKRVKTISRINSLNPFRFAPVGHLPLPLPVFHPSPYEKRYERKSLVFCSMLYFFCFLVESNTKRSYLLFPFSSLNIVGETE